MKISDDRSCLKKDWSLIVMKRIDQVDMIGQGDSLTFCAFGGTY